MLKIILPYSERLLLDLLTDFGWDFEGMLDTGGYHPVTTGNCQHNDCVIYSPHVAGNELSGVYQNAAASCPHCYPGSNPATLVWSQGMGINENVNIFTFPKQGEYLNKKVKVIFKYDKKIVTLGTIVRDDIENPFITIIRLDDGRYILSTECQYSPNKTV